MSSGVGDGKDVMAIAACVLFGCLEGQDQKAQSSRAFGNEVDDRKFLIEVLT